MATQPAPANWLEDWYRPSKVNFPRDIPAEVQASEEPSMGSYVHEIQCFTSEFKANVDRMKCQRTHETPIFEGAPVPEYGSGAWERPNISLKAYSTIYEFQATDKTGILEEFKRVTGRCPIEACKDRLVVSTDWYPYFSNMVYHDKNVGLGTADLTVAQVREYMRRGRIDTQKNSDRWW